MTSTTDLNDNLIKIDNLVTALNYIYEEIESRKSKVLDTDELYSFVSEKISSLLNESSTLQRKIARQVANDRWYEIVRDVESNIRPVVNAYVEQQLKIEVSKQLESLGYKDQTKS